MEDVIEEIGESVGRVVSKVDAVCFAFLKAVRFESFGKPFVFADERLRDVEAFLRLAFTAANGDGDLRAMKGAMRGQLECGSRGQCKPILLECLHRIHHSMTIGRIVGCFWQRSWGVRIKTSSEDGR